MRQILHADDARELGLRHRQLETLLLLLAGNESSEWGTAAAKRQQRLACIGAGVVQSERVDDGLDVGRRTVVVGPRDAARVGSPPLQRGLGGEGHLLVCEA